MHQVVILNQIQLTPDLREWCEQYGIPPALYIQDVALSMLKDYSVGNNHYTSFYEDIGSRLEEVGVSTQVLDRSSDLYDALMDYIKTTQGLATIIPFQWIVVQDVGQYHTHVVVDLDEPMDISYLQLTKGINILDISLLGVG